MEIRGSYFHGGFSLSRIEPVVPANRLLPNAFEILQIFFDPRRVYIFVDRSPVCVCVWIFA